MSEAGQADTDELLRRTERGDSSAVQLLLARHRSRLSKMVALRMDSRIAARVDPSDVVQLVLRYLEQLSTKDIAAVLGISTGAVKTRHFRAVQRLQAVLSDYVTEKS